MELPPLEPAVFIKRLNRFACLVTRRGGQELCHVPNSGRLAELLVPGAALRVQPAPPGRRTASTLLLVRHRRRWVMIDSHRTNDLLEEAVRGGLVPALRGAVGIRREIVSGDSRLDLSCRVGGAVHVVEAKCVTLVQDGCARFPDAPTLRGVRHIERLTQLAAAGVGAHLVFIVQRPDVDRWAPNAVMDPAFAAGVGRAILAGVDVRAYTCDVGVRRVAVGRELPLAAPGEA